MLECNSLLRVCKRLAQGAQGSCGCPIPLSVQGQAGWDLEQLGPGVLAHGRDLELDDLKSPFSPNLCDSMTQSLLQLVRGKRKKMCREGCTKRLNEVPKVM